MSTQGPIVVGSTYEIGGHAVFKITISDSGPVSGIVPLVTIIRDRDNTAANFVTEQFVAYTPVTILTAPFSDEMTELAFGTYQYEFNPVDFSSPNEEVYTVIYHYEVAPYQFVASEPFTFTDVMGAKFTGFGFMNRYLSVPMRTATKIGYKSKTGSTIQLTIYNPFGEVIIADVPLIEIDSTGIFTLDHTFLLQGDHILQANDITNSSTDAMIITVGGDSDRLKRVEDMLRSLTRTTPSVGPCR